MLDEDMAPLITDWRYVPLPAVGCGVLVGYVQGHPRLGDGWCRTSLIQSLDRAARRARSTSRWYRLGREAPSGELPPEGRDRVLQVLLDVEMARGGGQVQGIAALERAVAAAEALS